MTRHTMYRRQPKRLVKWARRILRIRAVSLSLVILPQIVCLAILAGVFYFLRVQEILVVPAVVNSSSNPTSIRCFIRPEQVAIVSERVPVRVDLLNADDRALASGEGRVLRLSVVAGRNVMDVQGSDLLPVVRNAGCMASPRVRIYTRVRSVLDIVKTKGGIGR